MSDHPYVADAAEMECDRELELEEQREQAEHEMCPACGEHVGPEPVGPEDEPERCPSCGEEL